MQITDGKGRGYKGGVSSGQRVLTAAVSESTAVYEIVQGNAYNINTGLITMSANGTLLYLKNNDDQDLVVETLVIGSFDGITYSNDPYISLVRNPTAGDLITDASAVAYNVNRNFGSTNILDGLAYKGKSGGTLTGGDTLGIVQLTGGSRTTFPINLILPKGASLGISLTANISSGSASFYAAAIVYIRAEEV